jgi:hypothetical protein
VANDVHGVQGLGFELTYSCTLFTLLQQYRAISSCAESNQAEPDLFAQV